MFRFDWSVIAHGWPFLVAGVWVTLYVVGVATLMGLAVGLVVGVLRGMRIRGFELVTGWYIELFRNTPILVQIVWFYYVLPLLTGTRGMSASTSCIISIGLNAGAYLAEVFRAGIQAVDVGQMEASRSLGMSYLRAMVLIILPQAIRNVLPAFVNTFVVLIKESAQVSFVGVMDIMHRGDMLSTDTSRPIEAYTAVAIMYFVICYTISKSAGLIERRIALAG
jgi:His/Glu/Gln/Arg/opine family amino acid ABC transporter permease subunit